MNPGAWRAALATAASRIEARFDAARVRLRLARGWLAPLRVVVYRGYGTSAALRVHGRVVSRLPVSRATATDSAWRNLRGMYRRFTGEEIPGARVRVGVADDGGPPVEARTDEEGHFAVDYPWRGAAGWHDVTVDLAAPLAHGQRAAQGIGQVIVPPPDAAFGVISDIDDTIVRTGATSLLLMARVVLLSNAHSRLPFRGVAAFYRALARGPRGGADGGAGDNPLFYVSSGPWNLYDLLVEFLDLNGLPTGPLFLQDWGLGRRRFFKLGHREHKLAVIDALLAAYPALPFVLIGDSGEHDPAIYREVVRAHPGRIRAIYIRDTQLAHRATAVRTLAEELRAGPTPLLLVSDTVAAAEHAVALGLIAPDALPAIRADKKRDTPGSKSGGQGFRGATVGEEPSGQSAANAEK